MKMLKTVWIKLANFIFGLFYGFSWMAINVQKLMITRTWVLSVGSNRSVN